MRFTYLELENYIGIYNGMGLNHIVIDMNKCMYRTLIIRGENGSGKSTIFKAMNVFPDDNSSFIPGMPARKVICLLDHDVTYTIKFFHGIKNNGDRDTTKAYISKNVGGMDIELNENGNVTSFKDILYSELSLDPNFSALSQLSLDDKGLADKKPAERKKFVNSIIESLEVYNNIYKVISKKSSAIKTMMDSLVAKLGMIGDINVLDNQLNAIEKEINSLNEQKDLATKELMKYDATINILDPDHSIQNRANQLAVNLSDAHRSLKALMPGICGPAGPDFTLMTKMEERDSLSIHIESLKSTKDIAQTKLNQITSLLSDVSSQLLEKQSKLNSLNNENDFQDARVKLETYSKQLETIVESLSVTGINFDAFTKDEFILALETLKDIKTSVDLYRDNYDYHLIEEAVRLYEDLDWPSLAPVKNTTQIQRELDQLEDQLEEAEVYAHESGLALDANRKLKERPKNCINDNCVFIKDLIELDKKYPLGSFDTWSQKVLDTKYAIELKRKEIEEVSLFNRCLNDIRIIIREIDKNGAILSRLPNGGIFSSKHEFFTRLLTGDDFSYIEKIYQYIDFANMVDEYHITKRLVDDYKNKCDLYASKSEVIGSLQSEISNLSKKQSEYTDETSKLRQEINSLDLDISTKSEYYRTLDKVHIPALKQMKDLVVIIEQTTKDMQSIQDDMNKINECNGHIHYVSDQIVALSNQIAPKMKERDEIKYKITQSEQYAKELRELQDVYQQYELIRHYSSPTKGISLVFMELYMGRILSLANELLSLLFNGEYSIQPFVIDESDFRIPCLGSGYLNDDISSMSGSQLAMVSMIISFALLHESSTKYNIIKLDEIDGPLDENNRIMFIDVMNRIMDIMNVEQCIMISHSSELQVDDSDVILLKSSQLSTDYLRGNIIWKY